MAAQVKLVRLADLGADVDNLDLYNFTSGFSLQRGGWVPQVAGLDDESVVETLDLMVKGTSHDNLASVLQNLDAKIEQVGWYRDEYSERYGVWLRHQLPDETYARQTLILNASGAPGRSFHSPPVSPGDFLREYMLILERMPFWEDTANVTYTCTNISCTGGAYNYGTPVGDVPARLARVAWIGRNLGSSGSLQEFWMGFRTSRFGTRANFVPVWELEDGVAGVDSSDDTTSETNTASPGSGSGAYVECDFSTEEGMAVRVTTEVQDVTANYADQRGLFYVLLRAKVGASTTCRVRLLDGFSSSTAHRTQSRVIVDSTDWYLYQLGTVRIPPVRGNTADSSFLRQFEMQIQAERTSGSNSLMMDCLILIPIAEGAIHASGGFVLYVGGDTRPLYVLQGPDGVLEGWAFMNSRPVQAADIEPQNYGLPVGAGNLILAAQQSSAHDIDDVCDVTLEAYERWRTLRGSET